ncbi:hypothetical protein Dip518_000633 [Parelusimicrobium proximum]|uniref:hypothetical protein n=1 Tax=Parelusimicrobium proximum TaxID=3228953 RepID=UPI003D166301
MNWKKAIIALLSEETPEKRQIEDDEYYKAQRLVFYEASMNTLLGLRLNITNLLITISAAMIAAIPYLYDGKSKWLLILALSLFILEIILGFLMNELDSKQLVQLQKANDGEDSKDYTCITGFLIWLMYIVFTAALIMTILLGVINK